MKYQSATDDGVIRVRPLEARDLKDVGETFSGAMAQVRAGPADSLHSFFKGLAFGRQNAWVAEAEGRIIGMAVVSIGSRTLARLTYLHVAGDGPHRASAARALTEIAIREAWHGGLSQVQHGVKP